MWVLKYNDFILLLHLCICVIIYLGIFTKNFINLTVKVSIITNITLGTGDMGKRSYLYE